MGQAKTLARKNTQPSQNRGESGQRSRGRNINGENGTEDGTTAERDNREKKEIVSLWKEWEKKESEEVGGGVGHNAAAILDWFASAQPAVYETMKYTLLDVSREQASFQARAVARRGHASRCRVVVCPEARQ